MPEVNTNIYDFSAYFYVLSDSIKHVIQLSEGVRACEGGQSL